MTVTSGKISYVFTDEVSSASTGSLRLIYKLFKDGILLLPGISNVGYNVALQLREA
jgi:hypothetical protein